MSLSTDLGKLEDKFRLLNKYKTAIFRLVLIRQDKSNKWNFYYGNVSLRIVDINIPYNELYKDKNIIIAEFSRKSTDAYTLMLQMKERDVYFINGPLNKIDINSSIAGVFEYPAWSYLTRETFNLDFPVEEIRLNFSNVVKIHQLKLVKYRSVHELIENKIGIDLDKHNGLPDTLSFFFEKGYGKILNFKFEKDNRQLIVTFDYDENKLDKYSVLLFIDKYGQQKIKEEIPLSKSIKKSLSFIPDNIEIRLIYEDKLIDVWREIIERDKVEGSMESGALLDSLNLIEWKEKIDKLKEKIKFPEPIQFGILPEKKLNDAEKSNDPEAILQKCSEAMEQLCKDFCNVFEINIKEGDGKDKGTLKIHSKIVAYWKKKTKLNLTELRHQAGLRQVVITCDLKKHRGEEYSPSPLESQLYLLFSWRAYFGILKMIVEIKKREN